MRDKKMEMETEIKRETKRSMRKEQNLIHSRIFIFFLVFIKG